VPEYFPQSVGAVTGLVGAAGGLGGFFPPLVLGAVRQATGSFTPGFVLLALFSIVCFVVIFKSGSKLDIKSCPYGRMASAQVLLGPMPFCRRDTHHEPRDIHALDAERRRRVHHDLHSGKYDAGASS
jgi:hypothetical protein